MPTTARALHILISNGALEQSNKALKRGKKKLS